MLILHYPERPVNDTETQPMGEHCDYGFLTMLMGSEKGLQLRNVNNEWVDIDPKPGCFVINIGDMLQKMTKGLYKSTPHRVVVTGKERYSIPYFYDPGWDQKISVLDIEMSKEEEEVVKKTQTYQRIDEIKVDCLNKTIGEYYIHKHSTSFPDLAEKYLKKGSAQ
jgi:isopenicillin N synthase-like dioxygenase